jgi:hypothetical protein
MPSFAAKPLTLETMFPLADDALHHLSISLSSPELKSCILNAVGSFLILENIPDLDCRKEAAATIVNRWLSFRRTPNDVHEMLSMSCKCSSPQTTDAIHVVGAGMAERNLTPGALLLGGFTRKLRKMLEETSDYNKSKIHHLSSRTSWPHNTGQLLPHGPDQTILGFLDWSTAPDARSAQLLMQALNSVMHYTWPLVLPIIVNNHLFLDQFIGAASYWFKKVNTLPWTKSQALHDTYAIHVISALLQLSAIMHLICLDFSDPTSTKHFLRPRHDDVLSACDHILSTAALISQHVLTKEASDIQNDIVAQIKPIGVAIHTDFPACQMRSPQLAALGVSMIASPLQVHGGSSLSFFNCTICDNNVLHQAVALRLNSMAAISAFVLVAFGSAIARVHARRKPGGEMTDFSIATCVR